MPHFGAGLFREALMLVNASPNVYLDTSSSNAWMRYHPGLTLAEVFRQALAVAGPDRLLFGTDSSYFPRGSQRPLHDQQRTALEALGVDASVTARVFGLNFDRLFRTGRLSHGQHLTESGRGQHRTEARPRRRLTRLATDNISRDRAADKI